MLRGTWVLQRRAPKRWYCTSITEYHRQVLLRTEEYLGLELEAWMQVKIGKDLYGAPTDMYPHDLSLFAANNL